MILLLVLILLVYRLSIKKTINEYSTCGVLEQQLATLNYAPVKIAEYQHRIRKIEVAIGASSSSEDLYQSSLLSLLSNYCKTNNITLNEFPEPHKFQQKNLTIETYPVTIKGAFIPMLKLMHYIEMNKTYGKIVSSHFHTKKDNSTQQINLFMTLYIQHVNKEQFSNIK